MLLKDRLRRSLCPESSQISLHQIPCLLIHQTNIDMTDLNLQGGDFFSQDDGCRLVLGLGPTPTSYCVDYPPGGVSKVQKVANLFSQNVLPRADFGYLELRLSRGNIEPVLTPSEVNHHMESFPYKRSPPLISTIAQRSTSDKNSDGYMPSLLFAPRPENFGGNRGSISHQLHLSPEHSTTTDCSMGDMSDQRSPLPHHHPKKCKFKGCSKGARGASRLCIAHGGGQRCQKPGCNKGAECRTAYCKAHGGGRRCEELGCTKSAEGRTDFCISHGGGRRCIYPPGCSKAARGRSGLCIRHGGGKRCTVEGCIRSAEGQARLCISHGGGRRCQYPGCGKGAQGSTVHCKAHGGGKRCVFEGCTKGAEGSTPLCKGHGGGKRCLFEGGGVCAKSVHGGTNYCVAHGGGKRCVVPGCTKSARGRTDCCVRHGGGRRCQVEGCGKSAQGSTDLCKAHGGGKRCSWGPGCEKFARGKSRLCASHGSLVALSQADSDGLISPGLFRGRSSSGVSTTSDCAELPENIGRRRLLISPLMQMGGDGEGGGSQDDISYGFVIPEGRVHGGGLMSLLEGSPRRNVFTSGRI